MSVFYPKAGVSSDGGYLDPDHYLGDFVLV